MSFKYFNWNPIIQFIKTFSPTESFQISEV